MKYVPKEIDQNVNRPKEHPLVDFVWLIVGTAVGIAILVFLAVQLSSSVADRISMEKEVELVDNQFGWKGKEGNTPRQLALRPRVRRRIFNLPTKGGSFNHWLTNCGYPFHLRPAYI